MNKEENEKAIKHYIVYICESLIKREGERKREHNYGKF